MNFIIYVSILIAALGILIFLGDRLNSKLKDVDTVLLLILSLVFSYLSEIEYSKIYIVASFSFLTTLYLKSSLSKHYIGKLILQFISLAPLLFLEQTYERNLFFSLILYKLLNLFNDQAKDRSFYLVMSVLIINLFIDDYYGQYLLQPNLIINFYQELLIGVISLASLYKCSKEAMKIACGKVPNIFWPTLYLINASVTSSYSSITTELLSGSMIIILMVCYKFRKNYGVCTYFFLMMSLPILDELLLVMGIFVSALYLLVLRYREQFKEVVSLVFDLIFVFGVIGFIQMDLNMQHFYPIILFLFFMRMAVRTYSTKGVINE